MNLDPASALLAVSAFHAGFQVVVSVVVYPALADVPADRWAWAHDRHSRRIVTVVAVLYPVLVAVCVWALAHGPFDVPRGTAITANLVAVAVTAGVAAPLHGALGRERTDRAVRALLVSDRVRTAAALLALAAACYSA